MRLFVYAELKKFRLRHCALVRFGRTPCSFEIILRPISYISWSILLCQCKQASYNSVTNKIGLNLSRLVLVFFF